MAVHNKIEWTTHIITYIVFVSLHFLHFTAILESRARPHIYFVLYSDLWPLWVKGQGPCPQFYDELNQLKENYFKRKKKSQNRF